MLIMGFQERPLIVFCEFEKGDKEQAFQYFKKICECQLLIVDFH